MRTAWRLLLPAAVAAGSIAMYLFAFAAPASAQTTGCTATMNGLDVRKFSTPKTAMRVRGNGRIAVTGTALDIFFSPGESRGLAYLVKLELAGASWTATSGVSNGQTWSGSVNVADYATRGKGIYKVVAVTKSQQGAECFGRAYIKVEGDGGPLSTTAGQVAAGVGLAGAAGAAAAGVRGGREIDEGAVKDAVGDFLEQQAGGPPPETMAAADEAAARQEMERRHAHELELMKFCLPLVLVAAVATVRAVASDVTHHVVASIGGMFR